jgi:hypothetical protein
MEIKMDKVKLEFKIPEMKTFEYQGVQIEVNPFLSAAQQAFLINKYLEAYFIKTEISAVALSEYDYLGAEFTLKDLLCQTSTNLDTDALDSNFYFDPGFWSVITERISNYDDFKHTLDIIVAEIKEQKMLNNQLGKVLSGLLDKLNKIFDNISPEEVEKLQKQTGELVEKLKEVAPLAGKV